MHIVKRALRCPEQTSQGRAGGKPGELGIHIMAGRLFINISNAPIYCIKELNLYHIPIYMKYNKITSTALKSSRNPSSAAVLATTASSPASSHLQ